jgi:nicotinamide mononucleotide (NMN) deamidase PncC
VSLLEPVWPDTVSLAITGVRNPNRQPVGSRYTDYAIAAALTTQIHDELEEKLDTERNAIQLKLYI